MSAADAAPPPAGSSPGPGDGGSSDKGEDTDVDAVTGLPVSFSGIFNTQVTDTNVPTVLSKLQKWGDYESYGEPVGPSRFIPMKTPRTIRRTRTARERLASMTKNRTLREKKTCRTCTRSRRFSKRKRKKAATSVWS